MKMKAMMLLAALTLAATTAAAQGSLRKVSNVEVMSLDGKASKLPYWGEKNLVIFYVDPDRHKQNADFTVELEQNHRADSPNIYSFGVINAKDSAFPNSIIRNMARKRTEKNGALVLADEERALATKWGLGDCNNQFVLMFVTKKGELAYIHKGELSRDEINAFYKVLDAYK